MVAILEIKKRTKAIIKKVMMADINFPYLIPVLPITKSSNLSTLAATRAGVRIAGVMTSSTRDVMMCWNAVPITTPTARSRILPFIAKFKKS